MTNRIKAIGSAIAGALLCGIVYIVAVSPSPVETVRPSDAPRIVVTSDRPAFQTVADLRKESDAVFVGTVKGIVGTRNLARDQNDPSKDDPNLYIEGVDYSVNILEYLKGDDTKQVIVTEQKQIRPTPEDPLVLDEDYVGMKDGETYIFFMKKSATTGKYFGVGNPFFFRVKGSTVEVMTKQDSIKSQFAQSDLSSFKQQVRDPK